MTIIFSNQNQNLNLSNSLISQKLSQLSEYDFKLKEIEEKKKLTALEIEKMPKEEIEKLFGQKGCCRYCYCWALKVATHVYIILPLSYTKGFNTIA